MSQQIKYWFPAKQKFGWGWGWPKTWQGNFTFFLYFVLLAIGVFFIEKIKYGVTFFLFYQFILLIALLMICWKKGEPPRWRWKN